MDQSVPHTLADLVELDPSMRSRRPLARDLHVLYRKAGGCIRRRGTRQGLLFAIVIYLLFSITDVLLIPDVAAYTIAARFIVAAGVLIAFEIQYRNSVRTDWLDVTCAVGLVLAYVGWLSPALMTQETQSFSHYMVFGSIFMMGANLFFSFRFLLSVISSSVILAAFFIALSLFPSDSSYQLALGTFYVSCFTFTSYVNWKLNKERYNVFLNALEAKVQHREATERGRALLRLSRTDPLTGLDNRRAIDEKLRDYWVEWQKSGRAFAVILIDIDFFKRFNDYYGHQEGDRCLAVVAEALKKTANQHNGSMGRFGGEEFILVAQIEEEEQVERLAEAIRHTIEDLTLTHDQRRDGTSVVTASVGASFTRKQTADKLEKVIHEADRALYLAKAAGKNCIRLFDPNDPESGDESENLAALLKIAIAKGLVSLVYQPIQSVATGKTEAVEALMRLRTLDGTFVPPSLFIPVAERTGTILELGRWAIRTACRELLVNSEVHIVSVNVSPIQLKTPGFASSVAAILGETGVSGSRLALEITEGLEMEIHSDILRCINELKLLGIKIWLDDFGTGFAGLSWLRLIDFDTVKIDRSFLHDRGGKAMLLDIVGLIRNRGAKILVEGVESDEQLALMGEFGIDQVQGYHVGRPLRAKNFRANPRALENPKPILRTA